MQGCWGKILSIDLSDRTVRTVVPPERLYREYIGAGGIGARLLYDMYPNDIEVPGRPSNC